MSKKDTNEPILVLIRRGRKGRGFTVSPADDLANPAPCANAEEVGEVIEEMMNDENQPRVDMDAFRAASEDSSSEEEDSSESYQEKSGVARAFDGVKDSEDPATRLLFNVVGMGIEKGQEWGKASTKRRARHIRRMRGKQ